MAMSIGAAQTAKNIGAAQNEFTTVSNGSATGTGVAHAVTPTIAKSVAGVSASGAFGSVTPQVTVRLTGVSCIGVARRPNFTVIVFPGEDGGGGQSATGDSDGGGLIISFAPPPGSFGHSVQVSGIGAVGALRPAVTITLDSVSAAGAAGELTTTSVRPARPRSSGGGGAGGGSGGLCGYQDAPWSPSGCEPPKPKNRIKPLIEMLPSFVGSDPLPTFFGPKPSPKSGVGVRDRASKLKTQREVQRTFVIHAKPKVQTQTFVLHARPKIVEKIVERVIERERLVYVDRPVAVVSAPSLLTVGKWMLVGGLCVVAVYGFYKAFAAPKSKKGRRRRRS
jgi:hypothetical protein